MASDVDICNLALSHLGDEATVASINPPEGSAQAEHCQRFYPIARNTLQEMHSWGFTVKRVQLAQLNNLASTWQYCYALPSDWLTILAIYDPAATDDVASTFNQTFNFPGSVNSGQGIYTPQTFTVEALEDDTQVLYTNQANAVMRYSALVTDTTKWSALFIDALGWWLASYLAGPVIKGENGIEIGQACQKMAMQVLGKAAVSDANNQRVDNHQSVSWMANR